VGAPEGLRTLKVYVRHGDGSDFLLPREPLMQPPVLKRLTSIAVLVSLCSALFISSQVTVL